MAKRVFLADNKEIAVPHVGSYIIDWCVARPEAALGGATGRSPIEVWKWIWDALANRRRGDRAAVVGQDVLFLDEYFGGYPSYYHWAHRNLRVDQGGFASENIFTPRGCFFEHGQIVNSSRLEEILADWPEEWTGLTAVGEDGAPPEIRVNSESTHPVLSEIRESMLNYDMRVRERGSRLQLLGVGVGGAIDRDQRAGGHIGFVEYGGAAGDSTTMLVRLASSTAQANLADFDLHSADGPASLEPANFAVTQGISTILSAGELLMMAWGESKSKAVERMFYGEPSPQNPAAWVQRHENVTVFLDRKAFRGLDVYQLGKRGWSVETLPADVENSPAQIE